MKKNQKPLESPSIRSYEHVVKRVLLNNLCLLLLIGLVQNAYSATEKRPVFVVLENGAVFQDAATALRKAGADVTQKIPPSILVADVPKALSISGVVNAKYIYTSLVSPSALEAYGPLAVAAAHQWNRQFVTQAQAAGAKSLSSMRVLVAQKSLPRIPDLQAVADGKTMRLSWTGLDGARVYEIEVAFDSAFSNRWVLTRSNTPSAAVPLPSQDISTLYARVRGVDHLEGTHKAEDDIFGSWSGRLSVGVPPFSTGNQTNAPSLSSPQDNFETEGFTLILEWTDSGSTAYRVQMCRDETFKDNLVDSTTNTREFVVPSQALHVGDSFYWRVQKWGDDTSLWSEIRRVRIGAPKNLQTDMFIDPSVPQ